MEQMSMLNHKGGDCPYTKSKLFCQEGYCENCELYHTRKEIRNTCKLREGKKQCVWWIQSSDSNFYCYNPNIDPSSFPFIAVLNGLCGKEIEDGTHS